MDIFRNIWRRMDSALPFLAAVAFVLIVGATAIAMLCDGAVGLAGGETCAQCAREWIGALSGWGAAVAAGATIFVLLRQSNHLERQTAFALGEDFVELAIVPQKNAEIVGGGIAFNIRVMNLGRRSIVIREIELQCSSDIYAEVKFQAEGYEFILKTPDKNLMEFFRRRVFEDWRQVLGWSNRNAPPTGVEYRTFIHKPGNTTWSPDQQVKITARYQTYGTGLELRECNAEVSLSLLVNKSPQRFGVI